MEAHRPREAREAALLLGLDAGASAFPDGLPLLTFPSTQPSWPPLLITTLLLWSGPLAGQQQPQGSRHCFLPMHASPASPRKTSLWSSVQQSEGPRGADTALLTQGGSPWEGDAQAWGQNRASYPETWVTSLCKSVTGMPSGSTGSAYEREAKRPKQTNFTEREPRAQAG